LIACQRKRYANWASAWTRWSLSWQRHRHWVREQCFVHRRWQNRQIPTSAESSAHTCQVRNLLQPGMVRMARSDLIATITSRFPNLMAKDAEIPVKQIVDAIGRSLAQGDRVEIRGFRSFSLNYRPARTGRNPRSGEAVPVPPKHVPHFKPGQGSARARRGVSPAHAAPAGRFGCRRVMNR